MGKVDLKGGQKAIVTAVDRTDQNAVVRAQRIGRTRGDRDFETQHMYYIPQRRPSVLYAVCLTRLGNIWITGRLTSGGEMWSRRKLGCSSIDRYATHGVFDIGRHPSGM